MDAAGICRQLKRFGLTAAASSFTIEGCGFYTEHDGTLWFGYYLSNSVMELEVNQSCWTGKPTMTVIHLLYSESGDMISLMEVNGIAYSSGDDGPYDTPAWLSDKLWKLEHIVLAKISSMIPRFCGRG